MARARWWLLGAVFAGTLVVAGVFLWFRDSTTPIDALELEVTVSGESLGDFGWYRYATEGFEEADVLQGGRHDYPADSYLTLQPGGCGEVVRWQPIAERWHEWHWCCGLLVGERSFHQWFGIPDEEVATCTGGEDYRTAAPGSTWTLVCTRERSVSTAAVTVVGADDIRIGEETVAAVHLRFDEVTEGRTVGTASADMWLHPEAPLVVRWRQDDESVTDSRAGDVRYVEQVTIELASPEPGS